MCGIIAMAGVIGMKEERMLRTLLVLDSLRGEDSTGIAAIPQQGEVIVAKELGSPFELFPSRKYQAAMKKNNRAIIGHNRFATSGGISKQTAHPFEFDTLVGVHNGTLRNKHKLADASDFVVDSENLYHHIEKNGLKDALDVVDGAYALVWWDKLEESLNILRNKERPMYMAGSIDNKTVFCASESWMLRVAAEKSDVKLQEIISTVEDMLYTFHIDKRGVLEKPRVRHMPSTYKPPVYCNQPYFPNQQPISSNVAQIKVSKPVPVIPQLETKVEKEKKILAGYVDCYLGKKDMLLEVMGQLKDKNGSTYISFMDPSEPAVFFRMYPNKKDPRKYDIGREILGEISTFMHAEEYFKISPHNITLLPIPMLPDKAITLYKYDDGRGHKLSRIEWEKKYPHCDFCFDPLFAEDHGNRLNDAGGCFCGKCSEIPEAIEFTPLKKVY